MAEKRDNSENYNSAAMSYSQRMIRTAILNNKSIEKADQIYEESLIAS